VPSLDPRVRFAARLSLALSRWGVSVEQALRRLAPAALVGVALGWLLTAG
jgi:hypothetical protein